MRSLRALWFVLLVLAIFGISGPVRAAPAAGSAVQQFGACLSAHKSGDLLLLIDQSGSLENTDPRGFRATAASYLLDQLVTTMTAARSTLNVAISGFDVGYQNLVPWTRLDQKALPGLRSAAEGFKGRHSGIDTDYVAALKGVQREFHDRTADGEAGCQAVLWFTDGKFDISQRSTSELRKRYGGEKEYAPGVRIENAAGVQSAIAEGRKALCRVGGIADQLRASEVLTIAEGLGPSNTADFGLLRAIATGNDGAGLSCGAAPQSTVGEFQLATNIDDLLFAFDALGDLYQEPTVTRSGVCAKVACRTAAHSFVLDASVRSVHVLAGASVPGTRITVRSPDGASVVIADSPSTLRRGLGGGRLTAHWLSDHTLDLTVQRARAQGWTGQWSITFVDPAAASKGARSRVQLRITGDLAPTVLNTDRLELRTGDVVPIRLALRSEFSKQTVNAADLPGKATVSAELRRSDGFSRAVTSAPVDAIDLGRPVDLDLTDVPLGAAAIRLTLRAQTAAVGAAKGAPAVAGTKLADRVVDVPLTILPPLNFPQVGPRLLFRGGEGGGPFPATIQVTGPGCVWVDGSTVQAAPDGVGNVTLSATQASSAESCLTVAKGATADLPVRLQLEHPGTGTVAGAVLVRLAPTGESQRALTTPVPFLADVTKPPAESVRTSILLTALLLGLGAPTLFLYAAKWWTARIPPLPLLAGTVRATIANGVATRDGLPFAFDHDDVTFVAVDSRGARKLQLPGRGVTLRTRTGWRPTAAGYTQVLAPGRTAVVDRLPLAVHNSWVALLDPSTNGPVDLQVLVSGTAGAAAYQRLSEQIRAEAPGLVQRARDAAGTPVDGPSTTSDERQHPQPPVAAPASAEWW